jgi:hypothetical protein
VAHQRLIGRKLVGHGVDAGHIEGFVNAELGQDAGHGAGDEDFAGAGWSAHQYVEPANCRVGELSRVQTIKVSKTLMVSCQAASKSTSATTSGNVRFSA